MKPVSDSRKIDRTARQRVLQEVVKSALTVRAWQECCADTMAANGIDEHMVKAELNKRARLLVYSPFYLQMLFICLASVLPYGLDWIQIINGHRAGGVISILAVMATQYLYQKVLLRLHNNGKSLSVNPLLGIAVGTIVPLLPALGLAVAMCKIQLVSPSVDPPLFMLLLIVVLGVRTGLNCDIVGALSTSRRDQVMLPDKVLK